jgi:hypothetical protein
VRVLDLASELGVRGRGGVDHQGGVDPRLDARGTGDPVEGLTAESGGKIRTVTCRGDRQDRDGQWLRGRTAVGGGRTDESRKEPLVAWQELTTAVQGDPTSQASVLVSPGPGRGVTLRARRG